MKKKTFGDTLFGKHSHDLILNTQNHKVWKNHKDQIPKQVSARERVRMAQQQNDTVVKSTHHFSTEGHFGTATKKMFKL